MISTRFSCEIRQPATPSAEGPKALGEFCGFFRSSHPQNFNPQLLKGRDGFIRGAAVGDQNVEISSLANPPPSHHAELAVIDYGNLALRVLDHRPVQRGFVG